MTQRKDETHEEFLARRRGYEKGWRAARRTLNKKGEVVSTIEKRARGPETAVKIPSPIVSRTSTLYDADNNIVQQWVQEKPEDKAKVELLHTMAQALAEKLPRAEPTPPVFTRYHSDRLAGYPIGDHHMGMLSWKHETGASYDLDIGERLLTEAFTHLVSSTLGCEQALIAVLGDFFHYDSLEPVTPTSRNILDADGRYPKMVMAGVRTIRRAIEIALGVHRKVHVIVEIGNHDLSTSMFLAILLANVYENEPRVTIDTSPKHFHYYRFGNNLIGTHHGHGAKIEQLPGIMSADRRKDWGECQHCYWWTGHVHSKRAWDFNGCSVESFRILPPADAYAANKGYRSHRSMEAIVFHAEHGEVARHQVNPAMLESARIGSDITL